MCKIYSVDNTIKGGSKLLTLLTSNHMDIHENITACLIVVFDEIPECSWVEVPYTLVVIELVLIEMFISDPIGYSSVDTRDLYMLCTFHHGIILWSPLSRDQDGHTYISNSFRCLLWILLQQGWGCHQDIWTRSHDELLNLRLWWHLVHQYRSFWMPISYVFSMSMRTLIVRELQIKLLRLPEELYTKKIDKNWSPLLTRSPYL